MKAKNEKAKGLMTLVLAASLLAGCGSTSGTDGKTALKDVKVTETSGEVQTPEESEESSSEESSSESTSSETASSEAAAEEAAVKPEGKYSATQECFDKITDDEMKEIIHSRPSYYDPLMTLTRGTEFIPDLYCVTPDTEAYVNIAPPEVTDKAGLIEWAAEFEELEGQELEIEYEDDVCLVLKDPEPEEPVSDLIRHRAKYGGRIIVPKNFRKSDDKSGHEEYTYVGEHSEQAVKDNFDLILNEFSGYVIPSTNLIMLARNVYTDAETGDICYDMLAEDFAIGLYGPDDHNEYFKLLLGTVRIADGSDRIDYTETASRNLGYPELTDEEVCNMAK
ncbi:MAG: hypothetical protein J6M17_04020 [Ruminococcus sp.]|nr:hypothetical protein [Ruminococcus sp.]